MGWGQGLIKEDNALVWNLLIHIPEPGKVVGASPLSRGREASLPLARCNVAWCRPSITTIWVTLGMERMGCY